MFKETLYAAADGPQVIVKDRVLIGPGCLQIIHAPFYGRILFRPSTLIKDCYIDGRGHDSDIPVVSISVA